MRIKCMKIRERRKVLSNPFFLNFFFYDFFSLKTKEQWNFPRPLPFISKYHRGLVLLNIILLCLGPPLGSLRFRLLMDWPNSTLALRRQSASDMPLFSPLSSSLLCRTCSIVTQLSSYMYNCAHFSLKRFFNIFSISFCLILTLMQVSALQLPSLLQLWRKSHSHFCSLSSSFPLLSNLTCQSSCLYGQWCPSVYSQPKTAKPGKTEIRYSKIWMHKKVPSH